MKRVVLSGLITLAFGTLAVWPGAAEEPAQMSSASGSAFYSMPVLMHVMGASATAQEADHTFLVDVHSEAGVTCQDCHGDSFTDPVDEAVCTDCHGSYAEIAAMTPWEPNPHDSHLGEIACSTCHNIHTESVSFCDRCHSFGMVVP